MTLIDSFTCITKICTIYLQKTNTWSSSCFSRSQYVPETLMQKNNMGIIGNDIYENKIRIMGKMFGKCWKE